MGEKMKKENKEIIAYKGFDKNLKCRDYQYVVGKTFEHDGAVKASKVGENGIKANTWYTLDAGGEFVEVENDE